MTIYLVLFADGTQCEVSGKNQHEVWVKIRAMDKEVVETICLAND